jgi:AraC-like DNA-binding protein
MEKAIVARELPFPGAYGLDVTGSTRLWSFFHEAYCVTVVSGGHGRWRFRKRDSEITPGSLMLMDPGEVHVTTAVQEPGSFHALFFTPILIREILAEVSPREPHFRMISAAQPAVVERFQRASMLVRRAAEGEAQREEFSLAVAALFAASGEAAPVSHVVPTTRVRKAARLLRERYEGDPGRTINVAEVAIDVGMSYHWLVHSFTQEFGVAPYQYVQALRLAKTRALLLEGPRGGLESLSDIANAVGFCDKSHLHRTMKRQYGVSPWQLALELNPRWARWKGR